ncbi:hypothetical protein ACFL2V_09305 [Pseudomonadota bacterium]
MYNFDLEDSSEVEDSHSKHRITNVLPKGDESVLLLLGPFEGNQGAFSSILLTKDQIRQFGLKDRLTKGTQISVQVDDDGEVEEVHLC